MKYKFLKCTLPSGRTIYVNPEFISFIVLDSDSNHNTIIYFRDGSLKTVIEQSELYFAEALDIKPE